MHRLITTAALLSHLADASPLILIRQAVTDVLTPTASAPPNCQTSYNGIFGIAVQNITTGDSPSKRGWGGGRGGDDHEWGDADGAWSGRPAQAPCNSTTLDPIAVSTSKRCSCEDDPPAPTSTSPPPPPITVAQVSQIGDGQIQGSLHTLTMQPINQIFDGQIQNQRVTYAPANYVPPSPTATPATANDGTVSPPPNTVDPTLATSPSTISTATASPTFPSNTTATSTDATSPSDSGYDMVSCRTDSSLQLHLSNSILTDALGRTGYIASNYQFQFDSPPQSESLYTAGWSVCSNGSLALGGSTVFWQCLSGEFYNLYDRNWAAQCSPINLMAVQLVECPEEDAGAGGNGTSTSKRGIEGREERRSTFWQRFWSGR